MEGSAYVVKCLQCLHLMFFADDDVNDVQPSFPERCPLCNGPTKLLPRRAAIEIHEQ
jgi:hypothetical protein